MQEEKKKVLMAGNFVKFRVECGPVLNAYISHDGEIERFQVMKVSGSDPDVILTPVLIEPVEVAIKIDHIATPIHEAKKLIRGEIVETVVCEGRFPGSEDDIGMEFLTKGAGVELEYNINRKSGYLTLKNRDDEGYERMHVQDGWISILRRIKDKPDLCYEISHYARLLDPDMDYRQIKTTAELAQHVTLNADKDGEILPIRRDFSIIWL